MKKDLKSNLKTESETGLNLFNSVTFSHKQTTTLENVTPGQASSNFKTKVNSDARNILLGLGMATVVSLASLGGQMFFGDGSLQSVSADLARCETKLSMLEDPSAHAITQLNNRHLAETLGLNNQGMFEEMKVEIYGPGNFIIQTKRADKVPGASPSEVASYSDLVDHAISAPSIGSTQPQVWSPEGAKPPFLFQSKEKGPVDLIFGKKEPDPLHCPINPAEEKNSCQPGDDPEQTHFSPRLG